VALPFLGRVGGKESGAKLVPLLKHDDPFIRTQTAVALGRLKAVDTLPQIEELLNSLKDNPAGKTLEIEVQQVIERLRAIKDGKRMSDRKEGTVPCSAAST